MLQNESLTLRSDFITRFSQKAKEIRTVDPTFPTIDIATMSRVCQDVLRKMCHARSGAVEQIYKIQKSLRFGGDLTFRGGLLAATKRGGTKEEGRDSTAPTDAFISNTQQNGAGGCDFLKKTVIVLDGIFEEVHSITITANDLVMAGLEAFGANIKKNSSANTHYLLAGKNAPKKKIKKAGEREGVRVINLSRMVRLLQGKLASVEAMNALVPLTKNNFTDIDYKRAVTKPVLQTVEAAETAVISASVTANSTRFEDEHADMDAKMASIDTSNMNTLFSQRLSQLLHSVCLCSTISINWDAMV